MKTALILIVSLICVCVAVLLVALMWFCWVFINIFLPDTKRKKAENTGVNLKECIYTKNGGNCYCLDMKLDQDVCIGYRKQKQNNG